MIGIRRDSTPDLNEVFYKGVPPYTQDIQLSSPMNSSPYFMDSSDLRNCFKDDPWRLSLLSNLDSLLDSLAHQGVFVPSFLIGGGFVRRIRDGSKPRDIDGLALYKSDQPSSKIAEVLSKTVRKAKRSNIDMRFCPLDANPKIMAKSLVFYSILFSISTEGMEIKNGLIMYNRDT